MKRSKIFMGFSAFVLAIVGIAATKANTKFTTYDYFTTVHGCQNGAVACSGGTAKCTISAGGQTATVYTTTTSSCTNVLFTKP